MTDARDLIRITDLGTPELTEVQRMALEWCEQHPVDLTVEAVLSAAAERTGLSDFGPDGAPPHDWRNRLRQWLEEVDADTDRTALGRATIFNYCVRHAANRQRIHDLLTRHPEIHDEEIVRPIIVVGLPRSGTTHLLNLISADTRLRSLPLWESYEPVPVPGEELGANGLDARFARADDEWQQMQGTLPLLAAMHPMDPGHVHEEIELQSPDFSSYNLEWLARVPGWRDSYLATDQTPHYAYMSTVLRLLQWLDARAGRERDRWVLKSPQHLEQLGPLLTTFPDATIVMTQRDPVSVVQSAATMLAYGARMNYRNADPAFYLEYWTDRIERLLGTAVRDVEDIPEAQRIDVPFHEFMADDVAMVERIYEVAGLPMTSSARAEIDEHMAAHPRGRFGQVVYDLRADFGVDPAEVRDRFGFYFDAFPRVRVGVT
ncbi:MAG: sulfotransferase family protein [Acidimicrobiia bacterium]